MNNKKVTGCFPLKALPPHRGHLNSIINAGCQVDKLYVAVSFNNDKTKRLCDEAGIRFIHGKERAKWLSQELQNIEHIEVLWLDETDVPEYPEGWEVWSKLLKDTIPEKIDIIFGGEPEYEEGYTKYYPDAEYRLYDPKRTRYPISGTEIRHNIYKRWDYILGSARPWFTKRVLITGSESTGKTTLTKELAKIYYTSWAEEEGRYYSERFLGGREDCFKVSDFTRIAHRQRELEYQALKSGNKVSFFDTDATVTQYYCDLYLGEKNSIVESLIDPDRYDMVFMMQPDVPWVDDGLRFKGDTNERWRLHEKMKEMYRKHGFEFIEVGGNYKERLEFIMDRVDTLISR